MGTFGAHIRDLRIKNKYSANHIAAFINDPVEDIWRLEQGKMRLSQWQLLQVGKLLNITSLDLLSSAQIQMIESENKSKYRASARSNSLVEQLTRWQQNPPLIKIISINEPFEKFIESIVYFECSKNNYLYERIMPDGKAKLIIDLDNDEAIIIGQHNVAHDLLLKNSIRKIIIRFSPLGLYFFTAISQDKLLNRNMDAYYVFWGFNLPITPKFTSK